MSAAAVPPGTSADQPRMLVPLDRPTCLRLLGTHSFGRLVFTDRAMPDVLPVNYRLDGDGIVLRIASGSRAAEAALHTVVAFQVDEIDPVRRSGWSITVVGQSTEITDPAERARIRALPLTPWVGGLHDRYVRIALDRVTGRELQEVPHSASA